jgi:DnaJ-class molecular chaperone
MFGGNAGADLGDLFGRAAGGGGRSGRGRRRAPVAEDVELTTTVPFETAARGGSLTLNTAGGEVEVKIPAGIDDGKVIRVRGQGPGGGDVLLKVRVTPHAWFTREGKDVLLEVPIGVAEAILGGTVEVPTVDGQRLDVKIRPGTSSGARSRLPGFGIAGGDQYLVFKVVVPHVTDAQSKKLIEEFAERHPEDPRKGVPWKK